MTELLCIAVIVFALFVLPIPLEWAHRNATKNRVAFVVERIRKALAYEG